MTPRHDAITRRSAERLLRDAVSGSTADTDPLVRTLAAAASAAPRDAGTAAGEEAALAAFREARGAGERARGSAPGFVPARWMTVKAAAVVLAAGTAGGVAVAAGNVSLQFRQDGRQATPGASAAPSSRTPSNPAVGPGGIGRPSSRARTEAELCRSYRAMGAHRDEALDRSEFSGLVAAADGKDRVAGYCARLLPSKQDKQNKQPESPPGQSAKKPTKTPNPNSTRVPGKQGQRDAGLEDGAPGQPTPGGRVR